MIVIDPKNAVSGEFVETGRATVTDEGAGVYRLAVVGVVGMYEINMRPSDERVRAILRAAALTDKTLRVVVRGWPNNTRIEIEP